MSQVCHGIAHDSFGLETRGARVHASTKREGLMAMKRPIIGTFPHSQGTTLATSDDLPAKGRRHLWLVSLFLLSCLLLISACGRNAPPPPSRATSTPQVPIAADQTDRIILEVLNNIKSNGFDHHPQINNGLGGLWINWLYGTHPLQTNFNGSGAPDGAAVNPPRHDPLTDLRYLHNLWLYKSLHPTDKQFDSEIARYTPIVKQEFAHSHNERGWLFDEFIDLYRLSKDSFYQDTAKSLASSYDKLYHRLNLGVIYEVDSNHPNGYYRVDLALEQGCALIQAGTIFNQPGWVADGKQMIQFVYNQAYIPTYHVFLYQMDNVLDANKKANPKETILRGMYGHTRVDGGGVRIGEVALVILSMLHVYMVTHDETFLNRATDLITPLTAQNNLLGLWDSQNLGYYASASFPGTDATAPGTPHVTSREKKESGRQLGMLEVFRVANSLTNNRYQAMQDSMLQVALEKAYYAPGHGVLFEMTDQWTPLTLKNGVRAEWVTTEAMGIMLEALFSLKESNPW